MPYRRRYRRRTSAGRRKTTMRRYRRKPRSVTAKQTYSFTRRWLNQDQAWTTDGSGNTSSNTLEVALTDLPNYTDYTFLFDQYKLTRHFGTMTYKYALDASGNDVTGSVQQPTVYFAPDKDDTGSLTIQQMLEHGSRTAVWNVDNRNQTTKRIFTPLYVAYETVGINGGGPATHPVRSPWIDMAQANIDHGALKIAVRGTEATSYYFDFDMTLRFMAQGLR